MKIVINYFGPDLEDVHSCVEYSGTVKEFSQELLQAVTAFLEELRANRNILFLDRPKTIRQNHYFMGMGLSNFIYYGEVKIRIQSLDDWFEEHKV